MKYLTGHTSPETAFVVDDYPYGFRLRCKIRYWLEYNPKRGFRFVSQTTNPKKPIISWNAPKASTYVHGSAVMTLDESNGHVGWICIHYDAGYEKLASWSPEAIAAMPEQAQRNHAFYLAVSKRYEELKAQGVPYAVAAGQAIAETAKAFAVSA